MKRLDRLVMTSFLGPMVMTFCIVMFILLMQFLWKYIDDLVGKGLDAFTILELLLYTGATLMPMAFPLAVLLASLMTMGNLGEHNELLAMKAAGISLVRIMRPMIIISVGITIVAFLCANYVVPASALKMDTLIYSVQEQKPELVIRPGIFQNDIQDFSIRVAQRDGKTNLMRDILIYDHSRNIGNVSVTCADSGYITITNDQRYIVVELFSGATYEETRSNDRMDAQEGYPARRVTFQRQRFVKRLEGFGFEKEDEGLFSESYNVLRLDQIWRFQDSLHQRNEEAERELFQRLKDVYVTPWRANADSGRKVDTIDGYALYDAATDEEKVRCLAVAVDRLRETKLRVVSAGDDNYYYNKRRTRYMVEFHRKFTLSIACLLFFLIGAPLGAIVRKGGLGFPMGISVLFFVLYYVISTTTEKFAKQLVWDDVTGMWFSTFVLVPMAVFLIFKAKNDSPLFRREWYGARIRRLGAALRFKSKGNSDSRK